MNKRVTVRGFVYRPKRRRGGKTIQTRLYRARVRFPGERKVRDIPLGVTEKRSAEQKLQEILKEQSQEAAGLLAPRRMRDAAQASIAEHCAAFLQDLTAKKRVRRYVHAVGVYVGTLIKECHWEHLRDVTTESFTVWRQNQTKAPKTLNEYLMGARTFFNWMVRQKKTKENPLCEVELVRVEGLQKRVRRAYAPQEVRNLLAVAGERMPVYLMAVLTGLRRGELMQLRWADVNLVESAPWMKVRASISKNHREAVLPLHSDLVEVLRGLRPVECNPESFIFKGLLPRTKRFQADLKAAGIDGQDSGRGRLDFHSFRVTYCTELGSLVGSERVRMELMRHHDPRLTAETYTDARMLPLGDAVAKLSFHRSETGAEMYTPIDTPISAQTGVQSGQAVSSPVTQTASADGHESLVNRGEKSLPVVLCHSLTKVGEWCALQVSNLRIYPGKMPQTHKETYKDRSHSVRTCRA